MFRVRRLGANAAAFLWACGRAPRWRIERHRETGSGGRIQGPEVFGVGGVSSRVFFRKRIRSSDLRTVERMVRGTGFFNEEEVRVARDLVTERLERGPSSGYHFLLAQKGGEMLGYTCYGPICGTDHRFDLYWIVVAPSWQGHGIGRRLLNVTEQAIRDMGGKRVYIETSSRPLYEPTRRFYLRAGYTEEARVRDFYAPGDHKIILSKPIPPF